MKQKCISPSDALKSALRFFAVSLMIMAWIPLQAALIPYSEAPSIVPPPPSEIDRVQIVLPPRTLAPTRALAPARPPMQAPRLIPVSRSQSGTKLPPTQVPVSSADLAPETIHAEFPLEVRHEHPQFGIKRDIEIHDFLLEPEAKNPTQDPAFIMAMRKQRLQQLERELQLAYNPRGTRALTDLYKNRARMSPATFAAHTSHWKQDQARFQALYDRYVLLSQSYIIGLALHKAEQKLREVARALAGKGEIPSENSLFKKLKTLKDKMGEARTKYEITLSYFNRGHDYERHFAFREVFVNFSAFVKEAGFHAAPFPGQPTQSRSALDTVELDPTEMFQKYVVGLLRNLFDPRKGQNIPRIAASTLFQKPLRGCTPGTSILFDGCRGVGSITDASAQIVRGEEHLRSLPTLEEARARNQIIIKSANHSDALLDGISMAQVMDEGMLMAAVRIFMPKPLADRMKHPTGFIPVGHGFDAPTELIKAYRAGVSHNLFIHSSGNICPTGSFLPVRENYQRKLFNRIYEEKLIPLHHIITFRKQKRRFLWKPKLFSCDKGHIEIIIHALPPEFTRFLFDHHLLGLYERAQWMNDHHIDDDSLLGMLRVEELERQMEKYVGLK